MPNWLKYTIAVTVSLVLVLAAAGIIFYRMLSKSLPEYQSSISTGSLSSPVNIYRDKFAVPYIFAETDEDMAFALGYCHAQERMFQMDVSRRAAEGRLSEVFGSATLQFDMMFKTIGIDRTVNSSLSRLPEETMKILQAYSSGVNQYIKDYKGKYPVEFDALGYDPYPWKPEHSLMIGKLIGWQLNISWWTDMAFTNLVQKLGEEKVRDIIPDFPENAPVIISPELKKMPEVPLSFLETDQAFRKFSGFMGTHIGSNNWAVNGKKSVTGKPIIANDPHLALQSPGFWYAAVLRGKTIRAEGFTVPGVPGVVIGKNRNISWVVTNAMLDDTDFYLEQADSTGKKYLVDGQWNSIKSTKYRITVKDSDNVELNVRETHRGPIISGVHPLNVKYPSGELKVPPVSMRWTGNEFTDELTAILKVNNASNWNEFKEGIKLFSVPAQNFVYADKEGNIGYYCAGRLPVRESNSPTFVFSGTTSANDWKGYVPFESMPSVFNPTENYIASANNKTVKDFPYHLSNLWEPPSRIERIHELLGGKEKHSVKDFQHYQNDFISPYVRELTGYITGAFANIKIKDPNLKTALDLLKGWNHELNDLSQVPTIEEVFFQFLLKNTFEDEMGKNLFGQYVFMANVPYRTMIKLLRENKSPWFDNTRTPQMEGRDEIIRKSLVDALDYIEKNLSSDLQEWQWGKLHTVTLKHMFSGKSGLVDNYINIGPYSVGGSGTTLFNTEYSFDNPYETMLGPSMRYIFDFSRPDEFYIILTSGESGNVFSPHYKDMTEMWLTGKYVKISTDENVIRNSGFDLTILR